MKHVSVSTIIAIFIIGFALLAGRHVAQRNHIIDDSGRSGRHAALTAKTVDVTSCTITHTGKNGRHASVQ